jgi:hypothetical protein
VIGKFFGAINGKVKKPLQNAGQTIDAKVDRVSR